MARNVNVNDPKSWDDDDKLWLKDRLERVPEQYRHLLADPAPFAPSLHAESPEMERLRLFLEANFPDDMAAEGETPVGLTIRLLEDYAGVDEDAESDDKDPGYEKWPATELTAEIAKRREAGREIPGEKFNKTTAAAALRADDATTK